LADCFVTRFERQWLRIKIGNTVVDEYVRTLINDMQQ